MVYYVELHCDVRAERMDKSARPACHTQCGDSPQVLCNEIISGGKMVRDQALKQGWRKTHANGWECPVCQQKLVQSTS